jgi:CBS domain-containing protein
MRVDELMIKDVSFCHPAMNAAAAAELMWSRDCGVLPVLEDSGQIVGVVTDRDLFIALGTQNRTASQLPVGEVMHRNPFVCAPEDDVRHALKTMAKQRIRRLPVVDEAGSLKGILSLNDLVLQANGVFKDDLIRTLKVIYEHQSQEIEQQKDSRSKPTTA